MDRDSIIELVLFYSRLGLCIIPIRPGTKRPACRTWEQYQTQPPDAKTQGRWFKDGRNYPAVILGSASGGLVCRDFDTVEAYRAWAAEHPNEANSLPTVRTARGYHVYCLSTCLGFVELPDGVGELRGDSGHYCVLPPAIHETGVAYEFVIPLPATIDDMPVVDPFVIGLAPEELRGVYRKRQIDDGRRTDGITEGVLKVIHGGQNLRFRPCDLSDSALFDIQAAIDKTQPTDIGQRNKCLFELARRLRGIEALADMDPKSLIPLVQQWHGKAVDVINTPDISESIADFLRGWQRVKFPIHADYIRDVHRRATADPDPGLEYMDEANRLGILSAMCRILQEECAEPGVFYLSCRTASLPFRVKHTTANNWLFLLEQFGYIRTVIKGGTPTTARKATRFTYCGPVG